MNKKLAVVLVVGSSLLCSVGLLGCLFLLKYAVDRQQARQAERQARVEEEEARRRTREEEALRGEPPPTFSDPRPPRAEDGAEFAPLLSNLQFALDREDSLLANRQCDHDRLFSAVVHQGGGRDWPGGLLEFRRFYQAQYGTWLAEVLVGEKSLQGGRFEIHRIRWSADRREAILITLHPRSTGDFGLRRWWVVQRGGEWKLYDHEDVYRGVRISARVANSTTPELLEYIRNNPDQYEALLVALWRLDAEIGDAKNHARAENLLQRARGVPFSRDYRGFIALHEARIHYSRREYDAALRRLDEAEELAPAMTVIRLWRACILNDAARPKEALAAVRAYQKELGPDPGSRSIEGLALEGSGQPGEALAAYRALLDDNPNEITALRGLQRTLPAVEKGELAERLAKTREPRKAYDALAPQAYADPAARDALLDGLLKVRPDDPRAMGDDVRRKVRLKEFAAALAVVKRGLRAEKPEDRSSVLNAYLFAMLEAQKPLEAYAAVPAEYADSAFRTLASEAEDELFDGNDPDASKSLTGLIAAHRKRSPQDPWLWYYEGALLQHAKEYEKAEVAYTEGAARLKPRKVERDPDERDWDADRFRSRRVFCLFKLKRGLGAYQDIGPSNDTFSQLASLYDGESDYNGLAVLIEAHIRRGSRDPEITYWRACLLYRKKDYGGAAPLYARYLEEAGEQAPSGWSARDALIRSQLRSKPLDAVQTIKKLDPDRVSQALRAAAAAATGDRAELESLLAQSARGGGKTWFYSDEDFRRIISEDRFRAIREKYPEPSPPKKGE